MARGAQAAIAAGIAVFGFDADPGVPPSRALQVLILRRGLPAGSSRAASASPPRRSAWPPRPGSTSPPNAAAAAIASIWSTSTTTPAAAPAP